MPKTLVIVESPTKAKTLKKFLGNDFIVESSVGHIRDLPANAAEIPAKYKKEAWSRLGVDVDNDFQPLYIVQPEKKKKISELRARLDEVDRILLATDEDREGEAISWHLVEVLKPKVPYQRMVFHEITKKAILEALDETREIDSDLVEAQESRRILDRLYGYEVSPVLWRKIKPRLSAGSVQSVATRILVDRERARMRFVAAEYWDLSATFTPTTGEGKGKEFEARLVSLGGKRIAGGKDFDPDTGKLKRDDVELVSGAGAKELRGEDRGRHVRDPLGGGEALHPLARRSVHDVDAPAGGQPQAALRRQAHDARGPTSLRERLHHLHADRFGHAVDPGDRPGAGRRGEDLRRRVLAVRAAHLQGEGAERAGSARGDPASRRGDRAGRRDQTHTRPGRGQGLRAHLEAHPRESDEGLEGAPDGAQGRREGRHGPIGLSGERQRHRLPRVLARVRRGIRRSRGGAQRQGHDSPAGQGR